MICTPRRVFRNGLIALLFVISHLCPLWAETASVAPTGAPPATDIPPAATTAPALPTSVPHAGTGVPLDDPKYVALFNALITTHQFDAPYLRSLFAYTALQPKIITLFDRPPEQLPFYKYQPRFITEGLVKQGQAYLASHAALLEEIEARYGVPRSIIGGILGIETKFGQLELLRYRAFDVLNTGFFLYPRREAFYRSELINFLLLCRKDQVEPLSLFSSYGGALGVPQFMPSSFLKYAVDENQDGKRDIWNTAADVFGSVAAYLKAFGWQTHGPLFFKAHLSRDRSQVRERLGARKILTVQEAKQQGIEILAPRDVVSASDRVSFVFYKPEENTEQMLAIFDNFRVLLDYNNSVNYALTVIDLAHKISLPPDPADPVANPVKDDKTNF